MTLLNSPHRHLHLRSAHLQDAAAEHGAAAVEMMARTLVERDSSDSSSCEDGDNSAKCQKYTSSTNTQTLPIVLGAVIPICCAIVVFIFLHRRSKKRQAIEDRNDPHKSLDFGMDIGGAPTKPGRTMRGLGRRNAPEMVNTEFNDPMRPGKKTRGLSMDMLGSPYLLPAGLQGSRESLHSMSRVHSEDQHDPYRAVALVRSSEETSRSPRPFNENGSMYSASTFRSTSNEKSNLLSNGYPMSHSMPRRGDSGSEDPTTSQLHSSSRSMTPSRKSSLATTTTPTPPLPNISESKLDQALPPLPSPPEVRVSDMSFPLPPEPPVEEAVIPPRTTSVKRPPRKESMGAAAQPYDAHMSVTSFYGDDIPPPPPPKVMEPEQYDYNDNNASFRHSRAFSIDTPAPSQQFPVQNNRLSVMGLRPLPPENPEENAEVRANRIRSFYKEYFDDSRPNPQHGYYEEDWDAGYYGMDAAMYDPDTGDYYMAPQAPYAQPMGRRAMTPPPRGVPRFGGPEHGRHFSTMTAEGFRGRAPPPKKKLPPPKALNSLPTPHKLGAQDTVLLNALDFAPPTSFREMQNGRRPDSPAGIQRPYSPSVRAFSPLLSSFDQMNGLPSPHHLRKSGTFTSLDFAPPAPKFRGQDGGTASDAGSIRSARSGNISAMQMDAVRAGAYRVSRIPKEMVTTREDLSSQLRPKMNLISPA